MCGGGGGGCISSGSIVHSLSRTMTTTLLGAVIALAMTVPTTQGVQPEACRLYTVTHDQASPMLDVPGTHSTTYISLDLMFDNSTASVIISHEDSSCQMTVDAFKATLQGNCFNQDENDELQFTQLTGMNTIALTRNRHVLTAYIHGDNTNRKVLVFEALNQTDSIQIQVISDTKDIVNTAFNCPTGCLQFTNAIVHSKENLTLSALQTSSGDATGVIKILLGEERNNSKAFNFTYPHKAVHEDDENKAYTSIYSPDYFQQGDSMNSSTTYSPQKGVQENKASTSLYPQNGPQKNDNMISTTTYPHKFVQEYSTSASSQNAQKQFYAASFYEHNNVSDISLVLTGSLIGKQDVNVSVGTVSSEDTFFVFEDMVGVLWSTCEHKQVIDTSTIGLVIAVTEGVTTDDVAITDAIAETGTGVTTIKVPEGPLPTSPVITTTEQDIGEMSCQDNLPAISCTLTLDNGAACTCAEAKKQGWCENLEEHPGIKDNCNRTCEMCPDQVSAKLKEKPPGGEGMAIFFVVIGILVALFLLFIIWCLVKKRRASGGLDLEGQSHTMTVQESVEKTEDNLSDTDKIQNQEENDSKQGTENTAFLEQEGAKENAQIHNEKGNTDHGDKNSQTNNENDSIKDNKGNTEAKSNGDDECLDIEKPTVNEVNTKDDVEIIDNEDDGKVNTKD